ncbi:MAG TPA: tryptophan--tRNA ligase, partial [Roseiarcus sp.]|nr:tryptophan--tRNA ligase [Roseiarcus sp.]
FKNALADLTIAKLSPIRAEILRLKADPAHVDKVLAEGAERARAIARPIMDQAKDVLGLIR